MSPSPQKPEPIISQMFTAEQIEARVKQLGAQITADYAGKRLHCVGILKGCFVFMADLLRHIDLELTTDFMTISSYGDATKSSGEVKVVMDLDDPIKGRDVLIIEDIVDTGLTMKYLVDNLSRRDPASLTVCTFLNKPGTRKVEVPVKYVGFEIPTKFVLGYGLDVAQRYRNLPYLGILENPMKKG